LEERPTSVISENAIREKSSEKFVSKSFRIRRSNEIQKFMDI
jgi:hypothetical protein